MRRIRKYWRGIILIASILLAIVLEAKVTIPFDNLLVNYYVDLGQKIIQNDYLEDEVHCSIFRPNNDTQRVVIYTKRPCTNMEYSDTVNNLTIIVETSTLARIVTVIVISLVIFDVTSRIIGFMTRRRRNVQQT